MLFRSDHPNPPLDSHPNYCRLGLEWLLGLLHSELTSGARAIGLLTRLPPRLLLVLLKAAFLKPQPHSMNCKVSRCEAVHIFRQTLHRGTLQIQTAWPSNQCLFPLTRLLCYSCSTKRQYQHVNVLLVKYIPILQNQWLFILTIACLSVEQWKKRKL